MSNRVGRNDTARGRRRDKFKEEESLLSVPESEIASQAEQGINYNRLNLGNHFAWKTICLTRVGDGEFPYLAQFLEKPDIEGDFKKETYVLYMEKGATVERDSAMKQTQTGEVGIIPLKSSTHVKLLPQEQVSEDDGAEEHTEEQPEEKEKHRPKRKKKMISEFYYIPKDRSRSRKRSKSKDSNEGGDQPIVKLTPDMSKTTLPEVEQVNEEETKEEVNEVKKEVEKKTKTGKGRGRGPDRWQLRAGADRVSESSLIEREESKSIENLKNRSSECLFESPSGTNKYLYVSKERGRSKYNKSD